VHGGQASDGRHGGGTDLDDDVRNVRQHRMGDVASETHQSGTDQEAPEERTALRWFPAVISVWLVTVPPSGA
jgi:hypothetical protein